MSSHSEHPVELKEKTELGDRAWPLYNLARIAGFVGIIGSVAVGYFVDHSFRRFYFAYLVSFAFFLSIMLGALSFVVLQHLTRSGWSVTIRRIGETLGATAPVLLALSAPILISVLINRGDLYRWAQPVPTGLEHPLMDQAHPSAESAAAMPEVKEEAPKAKSDTATGVPPLDALTLQKRPVLNRWSFTSRILFYFAVWIVIAMWYWRQSVRQDKIDDYRITERMQTYSAVSIILLVLTVTFAAFDLLMSLDPHWYSTMFGIYYLSGALLAGFATTILVLLTLQRLGYLTESVNVEHYHDLGKWLFGFVFFFGYIAFSQYMLIWYSNIPDETVWLAHRGATTVTGSLNGWSWVSIALLFGEILIPFAGLLSRHAKRNVAILAFWAIWILVFHWIDMYWLIMPELDGVCHFGLVEVLCFIGIGGIFMATHLRLMAGHSLRPVHDPRLMEAVAFENV
jgi:hypothetical protein